MVIWRYSSLGPAIVRNRLLGSTAPAGRHDLNLTGVTNTFLRTSPKGMLSSILPSMKKLNTSLANLIFYSSGLSPQLP